jgi:nucleoid-associated protein YgaU
LSVTAAMPRVAHADDAPVMVLVESAPPTLVHVASSPPGPAPAPAPTAAPGPAPAPSTASPPSATSSWRVERGQHLWGIAEATVHARGGGAAQVPGYWRTLVEANRDRLVVRDRPDLIFPGQDLVLPPGP